MAVIRPYKYELVLLIFLSYTCIHSEAIRLLPFNILQVVDKIVNSAGIRDNIPTLATQVTNLIENGGIDRYNSGCYNEDKDLNATQLIKKYSRLPEEHHLHTSDGYILTLIRIPSKGPPVFLFHGFTNSADDWLTAGPNRALPYLLAEQGYDVWLGNARGTKYSRRHERLSPVQAEFWDYTFDEIGRYDLPASIDYVLQVTGQKQLKYVGYSQGTTTFFVMCSEKPEYNNKISRMIALSPVAFMSRLISPLFRILALLGPSNVGLLSAAMGYEFVPDNFLTQTVIKAICGITAFSKLICSNGMFFLGGFNYPQLHVENMPVVFAHSPGGASMKQLVHYLQEVNSGKFRRYDYGMIQNLQKYGSLNPPDYPLRKVTAPVALLYSRGDWLSNYTDVQLLAEKLPNVIANYQIPLEEFVHLDFLWAKDVKELVYSKVLELLANA